MTITNAELQARLEAALAEVERLKQTQRGVHVTEVEAAELNVESCKTKIARLQEQTADALDALDEAVAHMAYLAKNDVTTTAGTASASGEAHTTGGN